jgi:hypothetical protein
MPQKTPLALLVKPFTIEALLGLIATLIGLPELGAPAA